MLWKKPKSKPTSLLIKTPKLALANIRAPIREYQRHLRTKKAAQQHSATTRHFWDAPCFYAGLFTNGFLRALRAKTH